MVGGFDGDDIRAEIWPQEEAEGLDGVGTFWLPPGETQLSELLVRLQHDHVWTEDDAGLLLLVVVDLDGSIVGHTEGDHLGLVTFAHRATAAASWKKHGKSQITCVFETMPTSKSKLYKGV